MALVIEHSTHSDSVHIPLILVVAVINVLAAEIKRESFGLSFFGKVDLYGYSFTLFHLPLQEYPRKLLKFNDTKDLFCIYVVQVYYKH